MTIIETLDTLFTTVKDTIRNFSDDPLPSTTISIEHLKNNSGFLPTKVDPNNGVNVHLNKELAVSVFFTKHLSNQEEQIFPKRDCTFLFGLNQFVSSIGTKPIFHYKTDGVVMAVVAVKYLTGLFVNQDNEEVILEIISILGTVNGKVSTTEVVRELSKKQVEEVKSVLLTTVESSKPGLLYFYDDTVKNSLNKIGVIQFFKELNIKVKKTKEIQKIIYSKK